MASFLLLLFLACLSGSIVWSVVVQFHERPKENNEVDPHWEVVPATDAGDVVGYRVRWSQPDIHGDYLWVAHYMSGEELSLTWCEHAAHVHCSRLIREKRFPWEWDVHRAKGEPHA